MAYLRRATRSVVRSYAPDANVSDVRFFVCALVRCAIGVCVLLAAATRGAHAAPPDEAQLRHFESKIRPLLIQRCGKCHGAEKQEGELRLDSPAAILRGGRSGAAVVAAEPEKSLVVTAIRYADDTLQMPPDAKLPTSEINLLIEWIKSGAAMPDAGAAPAPLKSIGDEQIASGRSFWAFQPPQRSPLPGVGNSAWLQSPVDAFILRRLELEQLTPAPPADRLTLLRRLTFDLTGLPPTPDAIEQFTADDGPDAWSRAVDQLLASPRYGERWARHWLDVARYSDSNGLDENVAHGNAYRYRDWVVAALNQDLPYDQFLSEQLAGDLLNDPSEPAEVRNRRLIATGFLSLGPKVLAEVDERKMEMDIVDEQIDTIGRSVLALTFGCVRCHDHKFDPLGLPDYYALAGIFKSTRAMEHFKKVARWHENPIPTPEELARKAAHEQEVAARKAAIEKRREEAIDEIRATLPEGQPLPKDVESRFTDATKGELKRLRDELTAFEKSVPVLSTAMGVVDGQVSDVAIHVRGSHLTLGQVVPRRFPRVLATGANDPLPPDHSGRLEFARWLTRPDHPLTSRVIANRLWRWHFGEGIVRSTDNFGRLGERPSHPELLDWLAVRLVDEQWSLKRLHRVMLSSGTYQSGTQRSPAAELRDPENRLLWRAPVRRLEAEAIRDSLLAVSQSLDLKMGGSLLHVKNREYLFDHTSKDGTKYDSPRRSLYLPVIRNNLFDVFQLFDYADASVLNGDRDTTTVAPQALFLLNSRLAIDASVGLARRSAIQTGDERQRVAAVYQIAFARQPTSAELDRAIAFIDRAATDMANGDRERAWQWLCQTVLASNEFLYVR